MEMSSIDWIESVIKRCKFVGLHFGLIKMEIFWLGKVHHVECVISLCSGWYWWSQSKMYENHVQPYWLSSIKAPIMTMMSLIVNFLRLTHITRIDWIPWKCILSRISHSLFCFMIFSSATLSQISPYAINIKPDWKLPNYRFSWCRRVILKVTFPRCSQKT